MQRFLLIATESLGAAVAKCDKMKLAHCRPNKKRTKLGTDQLFDVYARKYSENVLGEILVMGGGKKQPRSTSSRATGSGS